MSDWIAAWASSSIGFPHDPVIAFQRCWTRPNSRLRIASLATSESRRRPSSNRTCWRTQRAQAHTQIVVVHDTTEFEFPGESPRKGLGRLLRPGQGFFGHFALATTTDGTRLPLGLLGLMTIFRLDQPTQRRREDHHLAARPRAGASLPLPPNIDCKAALTRSM